MEAADCIEEYAALGMDLSAGLRSSARMVASAEKNMQTLPDQVGRPLHLMRRACPLLRRICATTLLLNRMYSFSGRYFAARGEFDMPQSPRITPTPPQVKSTVVGRVLPSTRAFLRSRLEDSAKLKHTHALLRQVGPRAHRHCTNMFGFIERYVQATTGSTDQHRCTVVQDRVAPLSSTSSRDAWKDWRQTGCCAAQCPNHVPCWLLTT